MAPIATARYQNQDVDAKLVFHSGVDVSVATQCGSSCWWCAISQNAPLLYLGLSAMFFLLLFETFFSFFKKIMPNLGKVLKILLGTPKYLSHEFTSFYYFATFTLPFSPLPLSLLSLILPPSVSFSFRTSKFISIMPSVSEYFSRYFLSRKHIHLR